MYLAQGVKLDGVMPDILVAHAEGANLRLQVVTELRNHGESEIFVTCEEALNGFLKAFATVFPQDHRARLSVT